MVCGSRVGSVNARPGGESGLLSSGVIGPGEGVVESDLHASLKIASVAPIKCCDTKSLDTFLWLNQGELGTGRLQKESSRVIQSLERWCTCQTTSLVR